MVHPAQKEPADHPGLPVKVRIKDIDKGFRKMVEATSKLARKPFVKVGVLENSGSYPGGMTTAEVATIHEFGAPKANIPERSFIRSSVDSETPAVKEQLAKDKEKVITGKLDPIRALSLIGQRLQRAIQKRIVDQGPGVEGKPWDELKEGTKRAKGSDKALIDTGQLRQSIRYQVIPEEKK